MDKKQYFEPYKPGQIVIDVEVELLVFMCDYSDIVCSLVNDSINNAAVAAVESNYFLRKMELKR